MTETSVASPSEAQQQSTTTKLPEALLVLSWIGVIFGAIGVLRNVLKGTHVLGVLRTVATDVQAHDAIWPLADAIVSLLLVAVLFCASIGVLRRRTWARAAMIGYALGALLWIVVHAIVLHVWIHPVALAGTNPTGDPSLVDLFTFFEDALLLAWSLYPLCVLYCMTRTRVVLRNSAALS